MLQVRKVHKSFGSLVAVSSAVMPMLVLVGFAALFWVVAVNRFRWEE